MAITANAEKVLRARYYLKDASGAVVEDAAGMFYRSAWEVARIEMNYGATEERARELAAVYQYLMHEGFFEPNSPLLANAGKAGMQYSACYVLPVEDSMDSIYETLGNAAKVHKQGGGTGFDFSQLRPASDYVGSTMGTASGPISFMEVYNYSTEAIKQGGMRRGANMGILRVDHPNVLDFITAKRDTSKITNFNISVALTDVFMRSVEGYNDFPLINPRTGDVHVAGRGGLKHPLTGEVLVAEEEEAYLPARLIFDLIVDSAWSTGEPGLFFIDRANYYNPVPHLFEYRATNPCGEQPLGPYDVCNLGSINLGKFVDEAGVFNWDEYRKVIRYATRFLDSVIDANNYPLPQITELAQRIRRIGLGVMGYADALIRLGMPYGTDGALRFAENVMSVLETVSREESGRLAEERGVFPEWERSIFGPDETCARDASGERVRPYMRLRNANITTVAPTGTISMIADCSSGIEPLFAVAFFRFQADMRMVDVNKDFVAIAQREGWYSEELIERVAETGHVHHPEIPEKVQRLFKTAHDVTPEEHVLTQAAFQAFCDSAISKTVNFNNDASREGVAEAYLLAYQTGCKGITVYRDGCRENQVLSTGATGKAATVTVAPSPELQAQLDGITAELQELQRQLEAAEAAPPEPVKIPKDLPANSHSVDTPVGTLHAFITMLQGRPVELFTVIGRAGSDVTAFTEALGRLVSLALRYGIPVERVADQLVGIGGSSAVGFGANRVASVPDALGKLLQRYEGVSPELRHYEAGAIYPALLAAPEADVEHATYAPALSFPDKPVIPVKAARFSGELCSQCNNMTMTRDSGCDKCISCGYSKC